MVVGEQGLAGTVQVTVEERECLVRAVVRQKEPSSQVQVTAYLVEGLSMFLAVLRTDASFLVRAGVKGVQPLADEEHAPREVEECGSVVFLPQVQLLVAHVVLSLYGLIEQRMNLGIHPIRRVFLQQGGEHLLGLVEVLAALNVRTCLSHLLLLRLGSSE